MNDLTAGLLVQLVIYGPFFTWMICYFFHRETMSNLRAEHREELQKQHEEFMGSVEEQRARGGVSRGDAYKSLSLMSTVEPGSRTFQEARLTGTVDGLRDGLNELRKRVSAIEADRKNDKEGAA